MGWEGREKAVTSGLGLRGMAALFSLDLPQEASLNREKGGQELPTHRR